MVRMKNNTPEVHRVYYYKPGQTAENTKISERSMALIIPSSTFERFTNYATENERTALLAERETKRLEAIKEATYNMSKSWDDTAQNIQNRNKKKLLSRKATEEAERQEYAKEMTSKNALERAEVVKQAKELLLSRRPHVRLINRALLLSECFRELNEQIKFQASMKEIYEKLEKENAQLVLEDVKKFHEEEQKKRDRIKHNIKANKEEIKKQIKQNENNLKKIQEFIKTSETEDLKNMTKELSDIKANELQAELKKKKELKKMFLNAIEDRRQYELKVQQDKEFEDKNLKIYTDLKQEMDKLIKKQIKNERLGKIRRNEILAKRVYTNKEEKRLAAEEKERKRDEAEEEKQKMNDLKMIEDKKQKRLKAYLEMKELRKNMEEEQKKRKKEEADIKLWETLQRHKRDEFNKEWNSQQMKAEKDKQLRYAKILKIQMDNKNAEKRIAAQEADYSVEANEMMKKANEKILSYGEKVLEESQGVRPIFPIAKVMGQFKREIGLIPPFTIEEDTEAPLRTSRRKERRVICTRPIKNENTFFFS